MITELNKHSGWLFTYFVLFPLLLCTSVKDVKGGADFAKAETLRKIHFLIQSMDKDLPRKLSM